MHCAEFCFLLRPGRGSEWADAVRRVLFLVSRAWSQMVRWNGSYFSRNFRAAGRRLKLFLLSKCFSGRLQIVPKAPSVKNQNILTGGDRRTAAGWSSMISHFLKFQIVATEGAPSFVFLLRPGRGPEWADRELGSLEKISLVPNGQIESWVPLRRFPV